MPKIGGGKCHISKFDEQDNGADSFNCDAVLKELNGIENEYHRNDESKRRVRFKFSQQKRNLILRPGSTFDNVGRAWTSWINERRKQLNAEAPKLKRGSVKLLPSPYGWYQVKIFNGHIYPKSALIVALWDAMSPDEFEPHYWRIEQDCAVFFTNDFEMAGRIQQVGRSACLSNGFLLMPRVKSGIPLAVVDDVLKLKMKNVMAKRYNAETKALNLTRFYADPDLKLTFCPLFQDNVMSAALDIICENVPDLMSLNLNNNSLRTLETFASVETRLPHLQILYLEGNQLPKLSQLWVFHKLPIVELVLRQNSCGSRYKKYGHFVRKIREKFPKLQKLNGVILDLQVNLDLRQEAMLPIAKVKNSFICNSDGAKVVRQFIDQYFSIFDSENRQLLLDAYHEDAMLSISTPSAHQVGKLKSFRQFNRMNGRLACVAAFKEFPRTVHEGRTFTVDLTLCTTQMMVFTVSGLFKEMTDDDQQSYILRHFTRTFVVSPHNGGFCIRNERIFIMNASQDQIRTYKRSLCQPVSAADTSSNGLVAGGETSTSTLGNHLNPVAVNAVTPKVSAVNDDATKSQMANALSARSQMNLEWSYKCLEDNNWDFSHATLVFDELFKLQQIPLEAFVK
ncbi:uncharacterized protein Dwil_GK22058 [Drosophila willistoni]|uniref:NTF2 domain-containing protein n=1 Tax=Drosophila willistoni TaxID=7260 RepID=B4MYL2_DROWI|nr:nuclear RNA export factor 1 [Drosophila willistoni]EDW77201.1 uncharacterized protein Dwil_GK22058 [Drosophila willistoni]